MLAELAALLPGGSTLWVGSSMPVRDLDTFAAKTPRAVRVLANRGANGIDGVVSSALGAAAAGAGPHVLAIGDVSFYHDMNGLLAAARHGLDLTIVLLNNDGGGIFSFLPQAEQSSLVAVDGDGRSQFEELFGTPHGLDFSHAAALYGARFERPADWDGFRRAVRAGIEQGGLHIVEIRTERARNVVQHRRCWQVVAEALSQT
jgi:2-succinyl-5-enolpyruvyl-6-hydroxy-3-cyclohexene-1-carboxylate synthase